MPKRKDITGQQFDELTVVEMLYNYQNKHRTYCRCIGIDGNEYIIRQDALVSGATHTIHGACSGGKQHEYPIEYWGGEEKLQQQKINDSIKNKYCKEKGIRLIRIPYTMSKDDIYKTIINLTSPATTTV